MSKGNFVAGAWKSGRGAHFASHNPATNEVVWDAASASAADVDEAMQAARKAFDSWSKTALEERTGIANRYRDVLTQKTPALAELISRETGKVLWDAKGEVQAMISKVSISQAAHNERAGEKHSETNGITSRLSHRPHGVAAVFGPYNFPGHLPNGHIVPALIAGNTVVFKPSDYTPGVAEFMVECWHEAGLPAGVLNLVQGAKETGVALAQHPELNALYFTGSVETGHILHQQFAGKPEVILALEMGGNNPLIVHEVQDQKAAVLLTLQSAFISTGQRCTCARRLIVLDGAQGDAFISALADAASTLKIGPYTESPEPFMGPLISNREAGKLQDVQGAMLTAGAQNILAMRRLHKELPFLTPAILDVTNMKERADREYFGPFLQVIRVPTFEAALQEANNTRYGLSAGIFTDNRGLYEQFLNHIHAGVIAWNRPTTGASSGLPFGGVGLSGNHRPSAYYAADYCAYPVAAQESDTVAMPATLPAGITL